MDTGPQSRAERRLAQALAVLGLPPGAASEHVEAAYFTQRAALVDQDDAERKLRRLDQAMRLIKLTNRLAEKKPALRPETASDTGQLDRALRSLGLAPGASAEEVEAAMAAVRRTVSDHDRLREFQKAAYIVKTRGRTRKSRRRLRHVSRFLIVASATLVVLTVFSGFQLATRFRHVLVRFEPGDAVFRLDDGTRFGVILGFEEQHRFPNGALRDAYQVRLHPDDKEAWLSAETARSALTSSP